MAERPKNLKGAVGGRKGGTQFPNYSLKQVLPNLKELTNKTHLKSIDIDQLNAGVFKFDAKSSKGKIRFSSLKQFKLLEGTYAAITASELAKKIVLSTEDNERIKFLREAFLNVKTFKIAFETFHGSVTNKAKVASYSVSSLKVHPESAPKFADIFLESAEIATICSTKGDEITFISMRDVDLNNSNSESSSDEGFNEDELDDNGDMSSDDFEDTDDKVPGSESIPTPDNEKTKMRRKSAASISVQIDPTLDPDKLEKQLKVLKKYGLI